MARNIDAELARIYADVRTRGWEQWVNVMCEDLAQTAKRGLMECQPKAEASIGLLPDDTFVVWYKPENCTWQS